MQEFIFEYVQVIRCNIEPGLVARSRDEEMGQFREKSNG
jgi:hypothetical protein